VSASFFCPSFAWIIDVKGYRRWAFPLVVVGPHSMAAYFIAHLWRSSSSPAFTTFIWVTGRSKSSDRAAAASAGYSVMLAYWLMLFWMYRKKIFLRI